MDRYSRIAAHVRALDDEQLNDLLLDLPPERYGAILAAVPADE
jgi:hypothetical protein